MPIRVYISPILKESPYLPEIRYAMQAWHTASDGTILFEETETPQNADIRVSWGYTGLLADFQDTRLGSAELTRLKDSVQIGTFSNGLEVGSITAVEDRSTETVHEISFTVEVILMLEGDATVGDCLRKRCERCASTSSDTPSVCGDTAHIPETSVIRQRRHNSHLTEI